MSDVRVDDVVVMCVWMNCVDVVCDCLRMVCVWGECTRVCEHWTYVQVRACTSSCIPERGDEFFCSVLPCAMIRSRSRQQRRETKRTSSASLLNVIDLSAKRNDQSSSDQPSTRSRNKHCME